MESKCDGQKHDKCKTISREEVGQEPEWRRSQSDPCRLFVPPPPPTVLPRPRYNADLSLEDAIHTAILTLKEGFEGQMTESTIEIGVVHVTPPAPKTGSHTSSTSMEDDPIDKTAMEVEAHLRRSAENETYMPTMFRGPPVTFRKLNMTEIKDYLEQL